MYPDADLLPISALCQLAYCERRAALILLEGLWEDNRFTALGRQMHERVHEPEAETRGDVRIIRSLKLRSLRLGITGEADVVEFHRCQPGEPGAATPGYPGLWRPFPIEYKRGKPKPDPSDEVQLCAQALCLEEMLGVTIPGGALFYGKTRRRTDVAFDERLRPLTESLCARLHALHAAGKTPPAFYEKKCDSCSLIEVCQPKAARGPTASRYLESALHDLVAERAGSEQQSAVSD